MRSHEFFTESINPTCSFMSISCNSYDDFKVINYQKQATVAVSFDLNVNLCASRMFLVIPVAIVTNFTSLFWKSIKFDFRRENVSNAEKAATTV